MNAIDLPIPIVVTRHQCPHCQATRAKKTAAVAHIGRCWKNPAAHGCKTCTHLTPPEEGPYPEHPGCPEACEAGQNISDGLVTGCPQWTGREDES